MKGKVLIAGFATRHVVQSAYRAGYEVYAIDHFCDQDLCWYTQDRRAFEELDDIPGLIDELIAAHSIPMLVVTSGGEDLTTALPVCGTPPREVGKFLDKLEIQHFFERHDIPVPRIVPGDAYPYMIKPRKGAGGWRNRVIRNAEDMAGWEEMWPDVPFVMQELVDGIPCSVSCIANGSDARAIAVNEQLLRGGEGEREYGFSGAITPFSHPRAGELIRCAEDAAAMSGCRGSIGIDFVLGDSDLWAIEINPRFQATLDTVEMATGLNLFDLHVGGCRGAIPAKIPSAKRYAVRSILFAPRDLTVRSDLAGLAPAVADIPVEGTEIEEGGAIVSVYGSGATRAQACAELDKTITRVRRYMSRW